MKTNKLMKKMAILALISMTTGCFQMKEFSRDEGSTDESSLVGGNIDPTTGEVVKSGSMTLAVVGQTRMFSHYQNVLKVTAPSALTVQKAAPPAAGAPGTKTGSLTIEGVPKTLNAPAGMATVEIASEFCDDLIDQETPVAQASRRFLSDVNLAQGTAQLTPTVVDSLIAKFSRAGWQRSISMDEKTILVDGMASFLGGATAADTRRAVLYVCTTVLASIDGYRL